ncbi:hypothetical protein K661_00593 [Piscirickettsia salmonis LF-89 = ATCC VR-1361]|nr:hypothetical protein K661_00593 [Piscirickettsia salmonis LF-89 = ATCC VR-1361]
MFFIHCFRLFSYTVWHCCKELKHFADIKIIWENELSRKGMFS